MELPSGLLNHSNFKRDEHKMWAQMFAVGSGAALGAWIRWGLGVWLNPLFISLPLGTLLANLLGAYLMGLALGAVNAWPILPAATKLLITTGFLGGLTTFSSFSAEVFTLLLRQAWGWAALAIAAHVAGSLLMTGLGWLSFRALAVGG